MSRNSIVFCLIIALAFIAGSLGAWETSQTFGTNFAYYADDHKGGGSESGGFLSPSYDSLKPEDSAVWSGSPLGLSLTEDETRNLGSGWGSVEIEFYYRYRATMPFLPGDGALTSGNNLRFEIKPMLSPASFHVETEIRWTPIAFFQFHGGVNAGTGWPLSFLNVHGLAMNNAYDISNTEVSGLATFLHMGATFQFDLAAVVPGDFNHIVISATARARYMNYSQADAGEAWYWRGDKGQNFNGWDYEGDYALGWQPPWRVNFIGLIAEHNFWLSKSIRELAPVGATSGESWGSDFHDWRFGPVMNIALKEGHGLTILLQFRDGLYLTEETAYARYFRLWETTGEKYIKLERLALAYSWNF